jgi:hypothetical protein
MRKAMAIPIVLIIMFMIMVLIGTYMSATSTYISKEYYRDLAEVRGYWGAYGGKELNISNKSYNYGNYSIDVNRTSPTSYTWRWELKAINSGVTNSDVYCRDLNLTDDNISIESYKKP